MQITVQEQIALGKATTEQALMLFDSLDPVELEFMTGDWKGQGFHTNHSMDGLLETYHWHGKRFESPEHVHPLVFSKRNGQLTRLNPLFMGPTLQLPTPKSSLLAQIFHWVMPLFATSHSKAQLRMIDYRGKSSATMVYDQLPINDVFRKVDQDTVLGLMDYKGMETPFFFILRRE